MRGGGCTDAGSHVDGLVDVLKVDISKCDIAHKSAPARVCLDPGRVARVDGRDILKDDVLDVIRLDRVGGGPHAADGHGARLAADDVADVDIAAVSLDRDAVLGLNTCQNRASVKIRNFTTKQRIFMKKEKRVSENKSISLFS